MALAGFLASAALCLATPVAARSDSDGTDAPAAVPAAVARDDCEAAMFGADGEHTPSRLIGEVISLDPNGGQVTLATRAGAVPLRASAETLGALAVGDVIVLELTGEPDTVVSQNDCP